MFPDTYDEWQRREEDSDRRREEALARAELWPEPHVSELPHCSCCWATRETVASDRQFVSPAVETCCEGEPECPWCGEIGGEPVVVDDSDPSVGYYAEEQMCSLCAPRARRVA